MYYKQFLQFDFCLISGKNKPDMSTNCAHASDRQNARHPRPPDPHPGISLSRLMLMKLQFLGRDAAGSNDHVQMANDSQILHLKPRARRLRNADNLMNAFAIVGTHLTHTRRLSVFIPGVLGYCRHPRPSSGTPAPHPPLHARGPARPCPQLFRGCPNI